jgi:hypothetical protein
LYVGHDGGMSSRVLAWVGGVAAGAAVAGLGVYFAVAGLGKASELAGVAGVFIGLAGLVVAVYGVRQAHRDAVTSSEAGGQSVVRSSAGGGITQVHRAGGSVRVGNVPHAEAAPSAGAVRDPAPSSGQPTPDATGLAGKPPGTRGGQSVTDSQAGGGVTQIDGAGGDVDVGG